MNDNYPTYKELSTPVTFFDVFTVIKETNTEMK